MFLLCHRGIPWRPLRGASCRSTMSVISLPSIAARVRFRRRVCENPESVKCGLKISKKRAVEWSALRVLGRKNKRKSLYARSKIFTLRFHTASGHSGHWGSSSSPLNDLPAPAPAHPPETPNRNRFIKHRPGLRRAWVYIPPNAVNVGDTWLAESIGSGQVIRHPVMPELWRLKQEKEAE
jgi:hypothetical protein